MLTRANSCIVSLIVLILSLSSCRKEGTRLAYSFNSDGGTCGYTIELDGSSLILEIAGKQSMPSTFYEDFAEYNNSQWFTGLDWIRVYYTPASRELLISTDSNDSSLKRNATVRAMNVNERVVLEIHQDGMR